MYLQVYVFPSNKQVISGGFLVFCRFGFMVNSITIKSHCACPEGAEVLGFVMLLYNFPKLAERHNPFTGTSWHTIFFVNVFWF